MSDNALALLPDEEPAQVSERPSTRGKRDDDLLGRRPRTDGKPRGIRARLDELFTDVDKGFQDQSRRADKTQDYWDCYNCTANGNRYYNGIADIYFPIVHDAVEALVTRWTNQAFPQAGRYVEVDSADGERQSALVALIDHYIRSIKFQTQVAAPLIRNGIVEGQINVYADWAEIERIVVSREIHGPKDPDSGIEVPGSPMEDVREEPERFGFPIAEVLHDPDVLVLPPTADSIEEALAAGGSVTVVRRWGKAKIRQLAKAGTIRQDEADDLMESMGRVGAEDKNIEKRLLEAVDIRDGGKKATCWETWTMLPLDDEGRYKEDGTPRLCRVFFGPYRALLGAKRNPYWNDRCPVLSAPLRKMSGSFKGPSFIQYVESLQYEANDAVNEGADAATLSAAPVVTRDAEAYNGPLVYNVGAVWDCPPNALKLLEFPDLTPRAQIRVQMALQAIFQSLGVNPSMLPQQTGRPGAKRNQAEVALEQQVDLLSTAVAVTVLEEGALTPWVSWAVDLDYQFRNKPLVARMFGEMGKRAEMQQIEPLVNRAGFTFIWRGGNQVRQNAMMLQQGTAWLNVLRGVAPMLQQLGWEVHLEYIIEAQTQNIFGPELGSLTVVNKRDELGFSQDEENEWLAMGMAVPVHLLDDDAMHMRKTMQFIQQTGDPSGVARVHFMDHQQQRQKKMMSAVMQMAQQQMMAGDQQPGGAPGAPQPGAAPAGPRLTKGPPGMIPPDQMPRAGAMVPPRRN